MLVVRDGLTGLPNAVIAVWSATVVQAPIVHVVSISLTNSDRRDRDGIGTTDAIESVRHGGTGRFPVIRREPPAATGIELGFGSGCGQRRPC